MTLRLVGSKTSPSGVPITTYEPTEREAARSTQTAEEVNDCVR
jgi:hypothetical protein